MPQTQSVLVSISIVVTAPATDPWPDDAITDQAQEQFLDMVAQRLGASVPDLKDEPWFEEDVGVNFHYLSPGIGDYEQNATRCSSCGRWTSDYNAPAFLDLLALGKMVDGRLVCSECRIVGEMQAYAPE